MEDDLDLYGDLEEVPEAPATAKPEQKNEEVVPTSEPEVLPEQPPPAAVVPTSAPEDDNLIIDVGDDDEDDEADDEEPQTKEEEDAEAPASAPIRVQINAPTPTAPPPQQTVAAVVEKSDEEDDLDILMDEPGQGPPVMGVPQPAAPRPPASGNPPTPAGGPSSMQAPSAGQTMQPPAHPTNRGAKPVPLGAHIPAAQGSWRPPPMYQAPKPAHREDGLPLVFPSEALKMESRGDKAYHIKLPGQTRVAPDEYKEFLFLGHGAIFDIDIERIDEKPWLNPGVNYAEYFNYDLTPYSWQDYAEQIRQYKTELSMKGRIKTFESRDNVGMNQGGSDLPPELAAAIAAEHKQPSSRPPMGLDHDHRGRRGQRGRGAQQSQRYGGRQQGPRGNVESDAIVLGGGRGGQESSQRNDRGRGPAPADVPFAAMVEGDRQREPPPPWSSEPAKPWESQGRAPQKPWEQQQQAGRMDNGRQDDRYGRRRERGGGDWPRGDEDRYEKRGRFDSEYSGAQDRRFGGQEGEHSFATDSYQGRDPRRDSRIPPGGHQDLRRGPQGYDRRGTRDDEGYHGRGQGRRQEDYGRRDRNRR
eukprot:scaffold467_cov366-Pavlova_lutheri.AAC.23